MYTTIDEVRRECIRLGTLLNKDDSEARAAASAIQVKAEEPGASGSIAALSTKLDEFSGEFSALLGTRAAEKAPR